MKNFQSIPTKSYYKTILKGYIFKDLENFSQNFLNLNQKALKSYAKKWVKDPLHQWSRQYEYPYVLNEIQQYKQANKNQEIQILDAGSGVTFFPYYLMNSSDKTKVLCLDYDKSLSTIYKSINEKSKVKVDFAFADIRNIAIPENSVDIIYCISVLEHTEKYEEIILEFKRILKPKGKLIVTWDVSLDADADIPIDQAKRLYNTLRTHLKTKSLAPDFDSIIDPKILTTINFKEKQMHLLPWKYIWIQKIINIIKLKPKKKIIKNLAVCCESFYKE